MFEYNGSPERSPAADNAPGLSSDQLAEMTIRLGQLTAGDDAERVDQIRRLEEIKSAAAAAQAKVTAAFSASQRAEQRRAGVPEERVGRGIAAQVGLARRDSPARATRYTGWAEILVTELRHTFDALAHGEITEWRAMIVARETAWLCAEHRAAVDTALRDRLGTLGDRAVEAETKKLAYRLDPRGYLDRVRTAERDRRVTIRPAPDTMSRLNALLPVGQGVAAYAALRQFADAARAAGDARRRDQIMADTMVERITGQTTADAVPVEINLVMTDQSLFNVHDPGDGGDGGACVADFVRRALHGAGSDEPALLHGLGPIPAELARRLVLAPDHATPVWVRRLYTNPNTGQLVTMDSKRRRFAGGLRRLVVLRDQTCRTPWCDAAIRHADHAEPADDGGPTSTANGQGLCEACNYAKTAPGWHVSPAHHRGAGEAVLITTPTNHIYRSEPPETPGMPRARAAPPTSTGPPRSALASEQVA